MHYRWKSVSLSTHNDTVELDVEALLREVYEIVKAQVEAECHRHYDTMECKGLNP